MSVLDDDVSGLALSAVLGVVGLVVAGVVALACFKSLHVSPASTASVQHIYFEAEGDTLALAASDTLSRLAEAARDNDQLVLLINGVQDARGDPIAAQRRALRVRHALEANGVPPSQLVLSKPLTERSGREARRVDVRLE